MTYDPLIEQIAKAMCERWHRLYNDPAWKDREKVSREEFRALARLAIRMYRKSEANRIKAQGVK